MPLQAALNDRDAKVREAASEAILRIQTASVRLLSSSLSRGAPEPPPERLT